MADSYYRSKYTGAKVDELLTKVLNGKAEKDGDGNVIISWYGHKLGCKQEDNKTTLWLVNAKGEDIVDSSVVLPVGKSSGGSLVSMSCVISETTGTYLIKATNSDGTVIDCDLTNLIVYINSHGGGGGGGSSITYITDTASGELTKTLSNCTEQTLTSDEITKLTLNFPTEVKQGFLSCINFRGSVTQDKITITPPTDQTIYYIQYGATYADFTKLEYSVHADVSLLFTYDAMKLCCYVSEVQDVS